MPVKTEPRRAVNMALLHGQNDTATELYHTLREHGRMTYRDAAETIGIDPSDAYEILIRMWGPYVDRYDNEFEAQHDIEENSIRITIRK